jgi:prephenate dehydrogenase
MGGDAREIRASVPNRPGVVAQLALALGRAGINITDMSLAPEPDNRTGVVGLWVRSHDAERAIELVSDLGFPAA